MDVISKIVSLNQTVKNSERKSKEGDNLCK